MTTSKPSIAETIFSSLRDDINNCHYESGQIITESEISKKFGVSKTPAREALGLLCQEGLLDKIPHKGYWVKSLSYTDIQHLFQFRIILETAAVKLAVQYASDDEIKQLKPLAETTLSKDEEDLYNKYNKLNIEFHVGIANLGKNPYISTNLESVLNKLRRALITDLKATDVNTLLAAHSMILEAIKERNLDKAIACTAQQIEVIENRLFVR